MKREKFESVWDAIAETTAEAENLKARSKLMMEIERHIKEKSWTQAEAGKHLGITQPRVSDLVRGKVNLFSLDSLINMLANAGLKVEIQVKDAA